MKTIEQVEMVFDAAQSLADSAFDFISCGGNAKMMPPLMHHVEVLRSTLKRLDKHESGDAQ